MQYLARWAALLLGVACLLHGCGGDGGDPPPGYVRPAGVGGGEHVFVSRHEGARSAEGLLRPGLAAVSTWAGARAVPLAAWRDVTDREANATFAVKSRYDGLQRGVVLARIADGRGSVGIAVVDEANAARLPALVRKLSSPGGQAGRARPRIPPMSQAWLPDGSGSLSLPSGWRISSAYRGAVDVVGPDGASMSLGHAYPITTPLGNRGPARAPFAHPFVGPVEALRGLAPLVSGAMRRMNAGAPLVRVTGIREAARVQSAMRGTAALVLFDADVGGRAYRSLALVDVTGHDMPYGWMYYCSSVAAPVHRFEALLPTMWAIWGSWGVSAQVLGERLQEASRSMSRTTELLTGATAYRKRVFAKAHTDWCEYIRGFAIVQDARTNTIKRIPLHQVKQYLQGKNQTAGYKRYEQVSLAKLAGQTR